MSSLNIDKRYILAIAALGFTSIVTQTILLREFLSVFAGNELVIGIVLANWMVLTGAGAVLGKLAGKVKRPTHLLITLLLLNSLFPAATVFLMSYLRSLIFPAGTLIGVVESLYGSFILLMPYCLTSGFLFTLFAQMVSEQYQSNLIASVYSMEAWGSIVGGFLFNLVLVFVLTTFQALFFLTLLNLSICFLLTLKHATGAIRLIPLMTAGLVIAMMFLVNLDELSKGFLFKDQKLLYYRDTPYGNLTVTRQGNQNNFYENSALLFSTDDAVSNEEAVHYAMIQHPRPKQVLLISGGISGTIQEILKYDVDRIDYVEINPWLIDIGRHYTAALTNEKVHVFNDDARKFVRKTSRHYDVALINVPDPGTAQINRYYTVEFLQQLGAKLSEGAVVSFSLLPSVDYLGHEARQVSSIFYNTLRTRFKNVLVVPGMRNYYLASDAPLNINIAAMIGERGIKTSYVNQYYVDDQSLRQRSDSIVQNISAQTMLNRDFAPVAYYRQVLYWLSYFQFNPWIPGAILLFAFLVVAVRLNTVSFGLFTGGFAGASIEMLLLISFQIVYGYVYQVTGIIITLFMTGLAVGSFLGQKRSNRHQVTDFTGVQCAIGIYSLLFPPLLAALKQGIVNDFVIHAVFFILTFIIAAFVGFEFSIASRLRKGKSESVAAELYSIDLVGSAIGALIVSIFLLPLLGIMKTGFVIASLNFASAFITLSNRKHFAISSEKELAHV